MLMEGQVKFGEGEPQNSAGFSTEKEPSEELQTTVSSEVKTSPQVP